MMENKDLIRRNDKITLELENLKRDLNDGTSNNSQLNKKLEEMKSILKTKEDQLKRLEQEMSKRDVEFQKLSQKSDDTKINDNISQKLEDYYKKMKI